MPSLIKAAGGVTDSGTGASWSNLANLLIEGTAAYAESSPVAFSSTRMVYASGHDWSALPDNAVITGVAHRVWWKAVGTAQDVAVNLQLNGLLSTTGYSSVALPTADWEERVYGGDGNLWGYAEIPVAQLKSDLLRARFGGLAIPNPATVMAAYHTLEVFYTVPAVPNGHNPEFKPAVEPEPEPDLPIQLRTGFIL